MTVTCGIQPTGIVTMAMEVLHSSYNMCIHDLPDILTIMQTLGIHIRQILHAHVTIITHIYVPYSQKTSNTPIFKDFKNLFLISKFYLGIF